MGESTCVLFFEDAASGRRMPRRNWSTCPHIKREEDFFETSGKKAELKERFVKTERIIDEYQSGAIQKNSVPNLEIIQHLKSNSTESRRF